MSKNLVKKPKALPKVKVPKAPKARKAITEPTLLCGFLCCGGTLSDRKMCTEYEPYMYGESLEDKFEDCKGLLSMAEGKEGERDGMCWSIQAMAKRSYLTLKFFDELQEKAKESSTE